MTSGLASAVVVGNSVMAPSFVMRRAPGKRVVRLKARTASLDVGPAIHRRVEHHRIAARHEQRPRVALQTGAGSLDRLP